MARNNIYRKAIKPLIKRKKYHSPTKKKTGMVLSMKHLVRKPEILSNCIPY